MVAMAVILPGNPALPHLNEKRTGEVNGSAMDPATLPSTPLFLGAGSHRITASQNKQGGKGLAEVVLGLQSPAITLFVHLLPDQYEIVLFG